MHCQAVFPVGAGVEEFDHCFDVGLAQDACCSLCKNPNSLPLKDRVLSPAQPWG